MQELLAFLLILMNRFYVGFDVNGNELGLDPNLTNVSAGNHSVAYWLVDDIENRVQELNFYFTSCISTSFL